MPLPRPRNKKTFLRILKGLSLSKETKSALADIGVEFDLIACEGLKELRADFLTIFRKVEVELHEHAAVTKEVRKAIQQLGGRPRKGAVR